ncbi:BRO family protein [Corynebacterium minutissimum]
MMDESKEPWFVLKDVCDVLELDNVARVKTRLDQHDLTSSKVIDSLGREQESHIVNESGL